ncbi:MAG: sugar phosphate isomerase/epimerase family protein [Anaerolineae bacterium]
MFDTSTIAVQLYSVRDELAQDFPRTLRKLASYGYGAVELARFPAGVTVEAAKSLFDDLDIAVTGAHSPLPLGVDRQAILDNVLPMQAEYLVCPFLDPDNYFQNLDGIKTACEMLNEANVVVKEAGLKLAYHNHWFEMEMVDGKLAYQHMLDHLDDDIYFELDTYWAKVAGLDPVQVMADLSGRLPLLHLKDGPAENNVDGMVALGTGNMDIPAILEASQSQWHIVELDRCDTDMLTAIKDSHSYLMELKA